MNTAEGRGIARRKAIDAQEESEEIGERVADAKKDNVAKGIYRGGGRPFGYEADGITPRSLLCPECQATEGFVITVVREDHTHDDGPPCPITAVTVACPNGCGTEPVNAPGSEAWYLEQVTRAIVDGAANRSELRKWHAAGVKTPARRKRNPDDTRTEPKPDEWTPTTFLKLLRRPRNAGLMEVDGEIIGKGAWPAIVDEETWQICEAVLKNPARRTSPGPTRKYLGGGLYKCGLCPALAKTRGRGTARNGSVYVCSAEGYVSRNAGAVDDLVERVVIAKLCSDAPVAAQAPMAVPDTKALAARRTALRIRLTALAEAFADDEDSDPVEYKAAARRIKERITAVEQEIADAVTAAAGASSPLDDFDRTELLWPYAADPDEALTWWRETYPLEQRRDLAAALVTVTILPAEQARPAG
ncbi:recombinase family protein [Streptomyces sp. NPDC051105]|uniref:recombinase family protein n=1 Tax=Streptomyces sp. NPDC051105 TaxID=3154843 RepID=UPI003422C7B5